MNLLPILSSALLLAAGILLVLNTQTRVIQAAGFVIAFMFFLLPITDMSVANYASVLMGDLSPVSLALLAVFVHGRLTGQKPRDGYTQDIHRLQMLISLVVIFLYPTALGFSPVDIYSFGYHPVVLTPLLLALFCLSVYRGWHYLATLLALAWISFQLDILDSNNLWDYLLDPFLAIWCLLHLKRAWRLPSSVAIQEGLLFVVATFLTFAVIHSRVNPDAFSKSFIIEDGFLEYATVGIILAGLVLCIQRVVTLRHVRHIRFLTVTTMLALVCLFGAGEEVSWGQRIFGIQSPEYFLNHNLQQETGLHNLAFEVNGRSISVNKLVFGTGLALGLIIYLFIMTPFYRTRPRIAYWLDCMAVPMPRNYHIIGYLLIILTVELLVDSTRRGEVTEFTGVIIFLLNLWFPYNKHIYNKDDLLDRDSPRYNSTQLN